MRVKDFYFDLPEELIASYPLPDRDASRLMVLDRLNGTVGESQFKDLASYLRAGDLLVMNDTRVLPARLYGHRETGGRVEILLVRPVAGTAVTWSCLLRASKKFRPGQIIQLSGGMNAEIKDRLDSELWLVEFSGAEPFDIWNEREGHMPLPPYLQRPDGIEDRERYQTVYSRNVGAVAAPTAGLHFTQELLECITGRGVEIAFVTLHTGLGTFQPVRVEEVENHRIHTEWYSIPEETVQAVYSARERGGRIIAVGTTTTRTLEYAAGADGQITAGQGEADIFIYPGYRFKVVDTLITNFHLPESTLLMLVSAFAGSDYIRKAYAEAIRRKFRFYSYGDAMMIM